MANNFIYVDHAATTPVADHVWEAMLPFFKEEYGNPSSIYKLGRTASRAVEQAREVAAKALGAQSSEIFFTSGGSESDNWAIKGAAHVSAAKGKRHIITTVIEHQAVLHTVKALEKEGFEVTLVPVEKNGIVSVDTVKEALRPDTALVSVMYANNEIGTLQPIEELGVLCKERDIWFHSDAVQAIGAVEMDVNRDHLDFLSLSGHKIGAPKGIGILYIRRGIQIPNLLHGGGQERGRRAGTENTPAIVGLASALDYSCQNIPQRNSLLRKKTSRLKEGLLALPHTHLNGDWEQRLASNLNLSFEGIDGENLLLLLDHAGIAASSGSACTSGSLDPSHVLLALGLPYEIAHGSLRISISEHTTDEEIDKILEEVPKAVETLRKTALL